jgi:hypothetical protein
MSHEIESVFNFHAWLYWLDVRAAEEVRAAGCVHCEGRLHISNYARKVRGLSEQAAEAGCYGLRLSFCCGREGCRMRATPPSARFSGRRMYAAIAVLALSLSLSGAERAEAVQVGEVVERRGAPARSTRRRWQSWWRVSLFEMPWFVAMCAQFSEPAQGASSPDSLLGKFTGALTSRLQALIVWLSPLTTCSVSYEQSRLSMVR